MRAGKIDVTDVSLETLVRAAYELSGPQGLGILHHKPGAMPDADLQAVLERGRVSASRFPVSMDYVNGRAVKLTVTRDGERLVIGNRWYDHSTEQLRSLLGAVGLSPDLVDKARLEEQTFIEEAIAEAVAFLKEKGGSYVDDRKTQLPEKIDLGLCYGSDPGPAIKRKWLDEGCEFSLAQP